MEDDDDLPFPHEPPHHTWTQPTPDDNCDQASFGRAVPARCPSCGSDRVESNGIARRLFGTLGTVAGAANAASRTWAAVQLGGTMGAGAAGPPGAFIGAIAGAVIGALGGAATGCSVGARLGDIVDSRLLKNQRCLACGHRFCPDGVFSPS